MPHNFCRSDIKVSGVPFSLGTQTHVLLGRELDFANRIPTLSERSTSLRSCGGLCILKFPLCVLLPSVPWLSHGQAQLPRPWLPPFQAFLNLTLRFRGLG